MTVIEIRKCDACEKEVARVFISAPNHDGAIGLAYCVKCASTIASEIINDCDEILKNTN